MTPAFQLREHLFEFTRNIQTGKELDDISNHVAYTDESLGLTYFLAKDFTDHLKRSGWVEGKTLFETDEAAQLASINQYLLSDAGQISAWPIIKDNLNDGDALYFSHGFGIVFHKETGIIPPENTDVVLVAPKGSGLTVRTHFQSGRGINSSFAIHQDYTGRARERCISTAFAIGSGHLFETTFENEVHSDLTGERCVLMGLLQGAFLAQYEVLRENGHSPSEAYNETIEEALQSLYLSLIHI